MLKRDIVATSSRFLSRDNAKWTLGDQYELHLRNVDRNASGFYRCINRKIAGETSRIARMGTMFFLDVKARIHWAMMPSEEETIPKEIGKLFPKTIDKSRKLRIQPKATLWSKCSQCGDRMGEQVRTVQCTISSATRYLSQNPANWIKLVGSAPCSSSLVPVEIRRSYKSPKVIQYRKCYVGILISPICILRSHAFQIRRQIAPSTRLKS